MATLCIVCGKTEIPEGFPSVCPGCGAYHISSKVAGRASLTGGPSYYSKRDEAAAGGYGEGPFSLYVVWNHGEGGKIVEAIIPEVENLLGTRRDARSNGETVASFKEAFEKALFVGSKTCRFARAKVVAGHGSGYIYLWINADPAGVFYVVDAKREEHLIYR